MSPTFLFSIKNRVTCFCVCFRCWIVCGLTCLPFRCMRLGDSAIYWDIASHSVKGLDSSCGTYLLGLWKRSISCSIHSFVICSGLLHAASNDRFRNVVSSANLVLAFCASGLVGKSFRNFFPVLTHSFATNIRVLIRNTLPLPPQKRNSISLRLVSLSTLADREGVNVAIDFYVEGL